MRIMATCAREALPCGSRIVCPSRTVPLMRPAAFAQESAFFAQPDTLAASGNAVRSARALTS